MTFLALNGTTIPCRTNGVDVRDARHREDRARMFNGEVRVSGGAIFREFTITTAFENDTDYATIRALINSMTLPLTATGDLIPDAPISVVPVPGSWTPIQTGDGFRRQAKFTLQETVTIVAPDTSAAPWAFGRRGVGYWNDRAGTIAAGDGDQIDRWDDASGNGRHIISHDGNGAGPDGTAWAGSVDYRPKRSLATNAILFGDGVGSLGRTEMRPNTTAAAINEMEILVGIATLYDPYGNPLSLWAMRDGAAQTYYPDNDGHVKEAFGTTGQFDIGDLATPLTNFNCYNVSGSNLTKDLFVRMNGGVIYTTNIGMSAIFAWNGNSTFVSDIGFTIGNGGGEGGHMRGWIRDFVIFDSILTDAQRTSWTNYIMGLTSTPPL